MDCKDSIPLVACTTDSPVTIISSARATIAASNTVSDGSDTC